MTVDIRQSYCAQRWIDDISSRAGHSRNELMGTFLAYALDKCVVEEEKDG